MPVMRRHTWVVVADGGKALLLEKHGSDEKPQLAVLDKETLQNPPNREHVTDKPGRMPDQGAQRSAMEEKDWHDLAEESFLADFAEKLDKALERENVDRLILISPDRALGRLRDALGDAMKGLEVVEIERDYTNHPVPDIEKALARVLFPAS